MFFTFSFPLCAYFCALSFAFYPLRLLTVFIILLVMMLIDAFVLTRFRFLALLTLIFLGVFTTQVLYRCGKIKNTKIFRAFFWFSLIFPFLYYIYLTIAQYFMWKTEGGLGKFLLPPYVGASYVIGYHFIRFYLYYLISAAVGTLFLLAAVYLNKKFGRRFFEDEEPYLGAGAISLVGYPGFFFYLIALFSGQLVLTAGRYLLTRKSERVPFYYLWLPAGVFVILLIYHYRLFYFS